MIKLSLAKTLRWKSVQIGEENNPAVDGDDYSSADSVNEYLPADGAELNHCITEEDRE